MPRAKKQKTQPTTEAQSAEGQSTSTTASSATDITLPAKEHLGPGMGYIIPCAICGEKVWIFEYDDDLVYLCGPCGDLIPD